MPSTSLGTANFMPLIDASAKCPAYVIPEEVDASEDRLGDLDGTLLPLANALGDSGDRFHRSLHEGGDGEASVCCTGCSCESLVVTQPQLCQRTSLAGTFHMYRQTGCLNERFANINATPPQRKIRRLMSWTRCSDRHS